MVEPIVLDRCPCGRPWMHYSNLENQRYTEGMVRRLGPTLQWTVSGRTWLIPRHYLAQHGLQGWNTDIGFPELGMPGCLIFPELPALTCSGCGLTTYNFAEVQSRFCSKCGVFYSRPVAEEG